MKTQITVTSQKNLKLDASVPGDKSISHRAMILAALAKGTSTIRNYLESEDCLHTAGIVKALGAEVHRAGKGRYRVRGRGLHGLRAPRIKLDCGNSGTTMRLLTGLLSAQDFDSVLFGDASLSSRPMDRVIDPLSRMGARIRGKGPRQTAPLEIRGSRALRAIHYRLPVPSAQVKSAVLLAGLFARGETVVREPIATRNHTEVMFRKTGIPVRSARGLVRLKPGKGPRSFSMTVPGDISSAAFFIAIGLVVPGSRIHIRNVLWNPTRTGLLSVLKRMGAKIRVHSVRRSFGERVADLDVLPSKLRGTRVTPREIPLLIDEVPILMVIATQAKGRTEILGADELRVKETDRIHSMVSQLRKMGARAGARGGDIWVEGPTILRGCPIESYGDHRTAMAFIIAGLVAKGKTKIRDLKPIATSFPSFLDLLQKSGVRF